MPRINNIDMNVPSTSNGLLLEDCICPICLEILIEPVTMPCKHELCMPCFQHNVQESLTCPICRARISSWARNAARSHKLINQVRWRQIRKFFPKEVTNRMSGRSDYESVAVPPVHEVNHILAAPGEIKQEYEDQIRRFNEQLNLEREQEEAASRSFIEKLQAFEAARLQVEENDSYIAHHLGQLCETDQDAGVSTDLLVDQLRQNMDKDTDVFTVYDQIAAEIALPNQSGATTSSSIPDSALFTATSNIQTSNSAAVSRYQIAGDTFEFASQRPLVATVATQTPMLIAINAESQNRSSLILSLNRSFSFRDKSDAHTTTEPPMATIQTMTDDLRSSNQPKLTGWASTACSCSSCLPENSRCSVNLTTANAQSTHNRGTGNDENDTSSDDNDDEDSIAQRTRSRSQHSSLLSSSTASSTIRTSTTEPSTTVTTATTSRPTRRNVRFNNTESYDDERDDRRYRLRNERRRNAGGRSSRSSSVVSSSPGSRRRTRSMSRSLSVVTTGSESQSSSIARRTRSSHYNLANDSSPNSTTTTTKTAALRSTSRSASSNRPSSSDAATLRGRANVIFDNWMAAVDRLMVRAPTATVTSSNNNGTTSSTFPTILSNERRSTRRRVAGS